MPMRLICFCLLHFNSYTAAKFKFIQFFLYYFMMWDSGDAEKKEGNIVNNVNVEPNDKDASNLNEFELHGEIQCNEIKEEYIVEGFGGEEDGSCYGTVVIEIKNEPNDHPPVKQENEEEKEIIFESKCRPLRHRHTPRVRIKDLRYQLPLRQYRQLFRALRHKATLSGAKKKYECYFCGQKYVSKRSLTRHLKKHISALICNVCNKEFTQKGHLLAHIRTHTGAKPFTCNLCNKSFSERGNMVRHMRTHTGEKPFTCVACNKSFSDRGHYKRHITAHARKKLFTCGACHRSFSSKAFLFNHLKTHTGDGKFVCEICNKSYPRKHTFQTHVRTHKGEKLYSCFLCNRSFSCRYSLKTHMISHTEDKPFNCDVCSKAFSLKHNLVAHMITHTRSKR